jgi:hypothetical protein
MTTTIRDSNGNRVTRNVSRDNQCGWGATVWFGGANGLAVNVRRYAYATRQQAVRADISDEIGQRGRVL